MTPFAIIVFYILTKDGNNFFSPSDLKISFWLFLAGAMTLIPLFLFLRGVELSGLGPTGMIFFFAPTGQFLLGILYYGESLDINKLVSFHKSHDCSATVTAVKPPSRFGELKIDENDNVLNLEEKAQMGKGVINGGFFVLDKKILSSMR